MFDRQMDFGCVGVQIEMLDGVVVGVHRCAQTAVDKQTRVEARDLEGGCLQKPSQIMITFTLCGSTERQNMLGTKLNASSCRMRLF